MRCQQKINNEIRFKKLDLSIIEGITSNEFMNAMEVTTKKIYLSNAILIKSGNVTVAYKIMIKIEKK